MGAESIPWSQVAKEPSQSSRTPRSRDDRPAEAGTFVDEKGALYEGEWRYGAEPKGLRD